MCGNDCMIFAFKREHAGIFNNCRSARNLLRRANDIPASFADFDSTKRDRDGGL